MQSSTFSSDETYTGISTDIQYFYPDSLGRAHNAKQNQQIVDTYTGSYSVSISLFGKTSITLGSATYELSVDNNVPMYFRRNGHAYSKQN